METEKPPLDTPATGSRGPRRRLSPNDRKVLGVLYGIEQTHIYLQHRRFTLATDCAALTWLFTSQSLSSKMHRWSMRLMQFDIDLWRKGKDTRRRMPSSACGARGHRSRLSTPPSRRTRRTQWTTKGL